MAFGRYGNIAVHHNALLCYDRCSRKQVSNRITRYDGIQYAYEDGLYNNAQNTRSTTKL